MDVFCFRSKALYALCYLLIADLLFTFSKWIGENYITLSSVTTNSAVCPPYFKSCLSHYFFDTVPNGYGQGVLYMVLGVFVFAALYYLYIEDFRRFVLFITPPLLYKVGYVYFFTFLNAGNYNAFGIFFGLLLLFSSYKVFYLRVLIVCFYLCAAVIKLHPGYFTGSVFTSLSLGAPIVPNVILPYAGIIFLIMCIVCPLLLIINNRNVRLTSLSVLSAFHIYTITMVGYRYPLLLLPLLWLLFYFEEEKFVFEKKHIKDYFGVAVILVMLALQAVPFFIQGDERLTGEGYRYGYYMYDGNHQCQSIKKITFINGETKELSWENKTAMYSCDPYEEWYKIKRWCNPHTVKSIAWTYDHSLNGLPYRRIVDEENACLLPYSPFSHNAWIHEDGKVLERPVIKNSI